MWVDSIRPGAIKCVLNLGRFHCNSLQSRCLDSVCPPRLKATQVCNPVCIKLKVDGAAAQCFTVLVEWLSWVVVVRRISWTTEYHALVVHRSDIDWYMKATWCDATAIIRCWVCVGGLEQSLSLLYWVWSATCSAAWRYIVQIYCEITCLGGDLHVWPQSHMVKWDW